MRSIALVLAFWLGYRVGWREPVGVAQVLSPQPDVRALVSHEVRVSESAREARRRWPDLTILGSGLLEAVEAREMVLRDAQDSLLLADDWPETVASEEASRLGIMGR